MTTAPTRCYYADQPHTRPDCHLIAVVQYGSTPLCASCARRRSTLGKGQRPRSLRAPTGPIDLLDRLGRAQTEAEAADRMLTAAVHHARQHGHSWTVIGRRLGVSRQAAQQRFARRLELQPPIP